MYTGLVRGRPNAQPPRPGRRYCHITTATTGRRLVPGCAKPKPPTNWPERRSPPSPDWRGRAVCVRGTGHPRRL